MYFVSLHLLVFIIKVTHRWLSGEMPVAALQRYRLWWYRAVGKPGGVTDVPHPRLINLRALHLDTPNVRLLHHLLGAEERSSEHRIPCSVLSRPGQGSLSSFPLCVEEMLH